MPGILLCHFAAQVLNLVLNLATKFSMHSASLNVSRGGSGKEPALLPGGSIDGPVSLTKVQVQPCRRNMGEEGPGAGFASRDWYFGVLFATLGPSHPPDQRPTWHRDRCHAATVGWDVEHWVAGARRVPLRVARRQHRALQVPGPAVPHAP